LFFGGHLKVKHLIFALGVEWIKIDNSRLTKECGAVLQSRCRLHRKRESQHHVNG